MYSLSVIYSMKQKDDETNKHKINNFIASDTTF